MFLYSLIDEPFENNIIQDHEKNTVPFERYPREEFISLKTEPKKKLIDQFDSAKGKTLSKQSDKA